MGRRPEPLFSLTISLQLVGELEEKVLVVDDLELAHVGLGLQVMGGRLHIQAWGCDKREAFRLPASLLALVGTASQRRGCGLGQVLGGRLPGEDAELTSLRK